MRSAVLAAAAVMCAGVLALVVTALLDDRAQAFTLGVPGAGPIAIPAGSVACQAPIAVPADAGFHAVRFALGTNHRPGPPVDVLVRDVRSRAVLGRGRLAGGYPDVNRAPSHVVDVGNVAAGRVISVCLFNHGHRRLSVYGNAGQASRTTGMTLDGRPQSVDMDLSFLRAAPRSLAALAPAIADRAALFRSGWIGSWTYVLLAAVVVLAVPLLLLRAVRDAGLAPPAVEEPGRGVPVAEREERVRDAIRRRTGPALEWLEGSRRAPVVAAAALIVLGAALVLFSNRGMYFWQDEWDFITTRHHLSWFTLNAPQNQNWLSTTVLGYRLLVAIFGVDSYLPYRIVPALLLPGIGVLMYLYARRRVGAWWALLPTALIVINPAAEIVIWPFQMAQLISLGCALGALLLLDGDARGRRRAVAIGVLLVVCVASSSFGVPLVAVVVYDRLLRPGRRIEALYAAPAAVAYVAWYFKYGTLTPYDNVVGWPQLNAAVQRAVEIASGHFSFFLGVTRWAPGAVLGRLGIIALLVLACWHAFGRRAEGRRRMLAIAGGLVTYWLLLAWGRADTPGVESDDRYIFGTQALLVLLAIQLALPVANALREVRLPRLSAGLVPVAAAVVLVLVGLHAVESNSKLERDKGYAFRAQAQAMRGQIAALDVLTAQQRRAAPFYLNGISFAFARPTALIYRYLHAPPDDQVDAFVRGLPQPEAAFADRRLLIQFSHALTAQDGNPKLGSARPRLTPPVGTGVRVKPARRGCVRMLGPTNTSNAEIQLPAHGVMIRNAGGGLGQVFARRFAADWTGPARLDIGPSTGLVVRFPRDRSAVPWHLRVFGQDMLVCTLR